MFARILEFVPKPEKKDELIKTVRQEILPILRKQSGFLEIIPFDPEIRNEKFITVSLWTDKREAEKYSRDSFSQIEQILKPLLTTSISVKTFNVETSICKHLADVLMAA